MNSPQASKATMPVFWKFVQLSYAFYYKSIISLVMTLALPVGMLLLACFSYYAAAGSPPITLGVAKSVSATQLQKIERVKIPGLQIIPISGDASDNVQNGKAQIVVSQEGGPLPKIYVLESNKAVAEVVASALSATTGASPDYEVVVAKSGNMAFSFLPGLLIMSLVNLALFTTGSKLLQDRATGTLRLYRLFPVPLYVFFSAEILTKMVLALVQAIVFILLGDFLLGLHLTTSQILMSIVVSALCALSLLTMGIAIGSNLRAYSSGVHLFTVLNLTMVFLGDMVFPNTQYPATRAIAFLLPSSHCTNLLRQVMLDLSPSFSTLTSVAYLIVFILLMSFMTLKGFRYTAEE